MQHGPSDGYRQTAARSLQGLLQQLPRDDAARRAQLLLRRWQRIRHHAGSQLPRLAAEQFPAGAKLRQILDVFQDIIEPEQKKYVCAPCSNCKGAMRDMFVSYGLFERCNILYGGLVELIVNAMVDITRRTFLEWEWH